MSFVVKRKGPPAFRRAVFRVEPDPARPRGLAPGRLQGCPHQPQAGDRRYDPHAVEARDPDPLPSEGRFAFHVYKSTVRFRNLKIRAPGT